MTSYSKSVNPLSSNRGWKTKDLFFIPRTQAESGELAKIRPGSWQKKTTTHKYQVCQFYVSQVHQYNRHFHVLTMSVAFLDLVSEPKDRLHPHFCAKVPVKRTWRSALKSKTLTEMDFFNCQFSIVTQRDYTHTHVPVAYVQGHSSCSQIYPFLPLSTG